MSFLFFSGNNIWNRIYRSLVKSFGAYCCQVDNVYSQVLLHVHIGVCVQNELVSFISIKLVCYVGDHCVCSACCGFLILFYSATSLEYCSMQNCNTQQIQTSVICFQLQNQTGCPVTTLNCRTVHNVCSCVVTCDLSFMLSMTFICCFFNMETIFWRRFVQKKSHTMSSKIKDVFMLICHILNMLNNFSPWLSIFIPSKAIHKMIQWESCRCVAKLKTT